MKPDTTLKLGSFTFARFEIPESIPFGGEHRLNVHELVGGVRVVDAMGQTPMPVEWSGVFSGATAVDRALQLDGLRKAGAALALTWDALAFQVVVRSFHADYKRFSRIPYRIVCEVVQDQTAPISYRAAPSVDQLVQADAATATTLTATVSNSPLTSAMGTLNTAIGAVSSFAAATKAALNSVLLPLATVRAQVGVLITSTAATIQTVTTVGGLVPGNPVAQQASALLSQIGAVTQTPTLVNLDRVLSRMQVNIGAINAGTKTVTVAGGSLYGVAAQQYGDPMAYTALQQANNLKDVQISGLQKLVIPAFTNDTNGVLNV